MDYQLLDDYLVTKSQAAAAVYQLNSLKETLYSTDGSIAEKADRVLPAALREALGSLLNTPQLVIEQIDNICSQISAWPVMTISLPFEPTTHQLKKISGWMAQNVKQKVLIETEASNLPDKVAGVEFEGRRSSL